MALTSIRRVVTGVDGDGRSTIAWDGPSPGEHEAGPNRGFIDMWTWRQTPLPLDDTEDTGAWPDEFPGPVGGGHMRVVNWMARADDPSQVPANVPWHEPEDHNRSWERGGGNSFNRTAMHKTQSVDYGIMLSGERVLVLDDRELLMKPGDIVVQVGAWHLWDNTRVGCLMAFDMIGAEFVDGPAGTAQGDDPVMLPDVDRRVPPGARPHRRIVTIDREPGRSSLVSDGPAPDVRLDPARPGFALERLWVVEKAPAPIVHETLHLPHVLVPPANGSVLNVVTVPPDRLWRDRVTSDDVAAWFASVGAPEASSYAPGAPNPYMQKTRTVDFCFVLEGEAWLQLDTQDVLVRKGEIVVQRGTNHAWSNPTDTPAVIAIASHDAG